MSDEALMRRCLTLAERGRSAVGNGAMVGAVLVRDGTIIAEGWHQRFSCPHAERVLLEHFDQKIRSSDVLTLNLGPCCHHGKTPPCTDLIIEQGIQHVVVGMEDPDLRVRGKGIAILRQHGIDVTGPVLPELCERLNRGFVSVRRQNRPWITLKKAQTKDGRIAGEDKSTLRITSHDQDVWSHTFLRACHDAILVGVHTVITDDPRLDCRLAGGREQSPFQPWRIILDPELRTPPTARVVTDGASRRTIIIAADADVEREQALSAQGARIMHAELQGETFDWNGLWRALTTPTADFPGLTSILVEGGRRTWGAFRAGGFVDEEVTLVGRA